MTLCHYGGYMSKTKKIIIFTAILLFVLACTALFIVSRRIDNSSIVVEGNEYYTDEEIIDFILTDKWDRNPYIIYYKTKYKEQKIIPFVDKYEVEIVSGSSIKITIYEKKIIGYVTYMGSNMYFDKDGTMVESSTEVLENIPKVTGLEFDSIVLYEPLPVGDGEVFDLILDVTQTLQKYSIGVDKIYITDNKEVSVYIGDVKVELGKNENMVEKISSLNDIITTSNFDGQTLSGVLDMKVYNENGEYTFERNDKKN